MLNVEREATIGILDQLTQHGRIDDVSFERVRVEQHRGVVNCDGPKRLHGRQSPGLNLISIA